MKSDTPRTDELINSIAYKSLKAMLLGKLCKQLERELNELKAKTTWQPIETAPKDGTVILVGYSPVWADRIAGRMVHEALYHEIPKEFRATNGFISHKDATHWMPLPGVPEE